MSTRRLLFESIRHYWRTHLGVVLGSALATLVLTGALMVGDSVKATLREQALARVGKIGEALLCGERFVTWPHEAEKRPQVVARTFAPGPDAAGVLMLSGTAASADGNSRANKVQIVGVDEAFWKLSPSGKDPFATTAATENSPEAGSRNAPRSGRIPGGAPDSGAVSGDSPETPREAPQSGRVSGQRKPTEVFPAGSPGTALGSSAPPEAPSIVLNERLAAQLGVKPGDEVLLRMEKPSAISKDAPLSGEEDGTVTLRMSVARIVGDADFGRFALTSGQVPPFTAFVPLAALQEKLGVGAKVNLVLDGTQPDEGAPQSQPGAFAGWFRGLFGPRCVSVGKLVVPDGKSSVAKSDLGSPSTPPGLLEAFEIKIHELPNAAGFEVRTPRIFLEQPLIDAARANEREISVAAEKIRNPKSEIRNPPRGLDSLTYFVNGLHAGDGSDAKAPATPYSMVTAIDAPASGFLQAELADDEIQITRWLADDLGVGPGDKVTIKYYVMGERRQLLEKARTFTVLAPILEMDEPQLNSSWMPDFPGLADKENCRDWKPGFDFDATRMRDKDQDYWTKHRGTPKAFVNLRAGQEMWANRWGSLTSIRYPAGTTREQVERIAAFIDPAALGFRVVNLREQALAATDAPVDFGGLFVSFSFFLIAAAAVLTGLLFTFTIEQRATEAGVLLATGWPVKKVRRLFLREGFVLALAGSLAGAFLAALYTRAVLAALAGVWGGATGGTKFVFAPAGLTIGIGIASGVIVALIAMWLASRRLFKMEAAALIAGSLQHDRAAQPSSRARESAGTLSDGGSVRGSARALTSAATCAVAALLLAVFAKGNSGAFFGAGALLLIAGCLFSLARLRRAAEGTGADSVAQLAARNTARRRGRSLAAIAVLASGVFMVIAVDSFRNAAPGDTMRRDSGTGGFAFIGESSAPIYEDLNSAKGREIYALDDKLMSGVRVVQMRVRDGDDASCLNLNKAVQPRVLGLDFKQLADRGAAPGEAHGSGRPGKAPASSGADRAASSPNRFGLSWPGVAAKATREGAAPAVVDANTLQWAMKKKVGDVIEIPGERGQPARIEIAATVPASILQGLVIIPEGDFVEKFPNTAGTRFFLVDCPREKMDAVREHLTRQLGDRGLELTPAAKRLAEFNEVENTYLSIFQVLGGLGMLLGSAGLGIVVARNVFERRREFGLLEAVGFPVRMLRALVAAEHRWLIVGAVVIGGVSALVAVFPRLAGQASAFPWRGILTLLAGTTLLSAFWVWLATRLALRRSQIPALRSE